MAVIVVAGVAIRAILMPHLGHVHDTACFYEWARVLSERTVADVYLDPTAVEKMMRVNYPPVYLDVLALLPGFHDAWTRGDRWNDPATAHGLRREVMRLSYQPYIGDLHDARSEGLKLGAKNLQDIMVDMEYAGLGQAFHGAGVQTYADYLRFLEKRFVNTSHLGPDHESVLVFLKLPAVAGDLVLALLLFAAGWRWAGRWPAVLAAGGVLLSPMVIHVSAFWGQVDSIPTLLVVACLIALLTGTLPLAFLLLAVALLTKLQAIVVAPVVGGVAVAMLVERWGAKDGSFRKAAARLGAALAVAGLGAAVILMPIVRGGALGALLDVYRGLGSQYPFLTVRAMNLWWLFTNGDQTMGFEASPRDDVTTALGVTPKAIGLALLLVVAGLVVAAVVRRRAERATVVLGAVTMAMAFFCLPTEIHERYGFPIVPLAILAALVVSRRYWWVAGIASLTHFANLFFAGLGDRPGGLPGGGLALALATTPTVTYTIAVVNLALLAIALRDLYRRALAGPPTGGRTAETARPGGTAARRR